jgi:hypothetical protein
MTNSKISNASSVSRSSSKSGRQKGLALDDFVILKFLEEGQFGAVYLVKYINSDADTRSLTLYAPSRKYLSAYSRGSKSLWVRLFAK